MAKKAPGCFRKPIAEKKFEKKFLKNIEQPADKAFLSSCFEHADGFFTILPGLDEAALKRLHGLVKVIKKNRKMALNILPFVFLLVLIGGIGVFVTVFMNPLLEKGLENLLELVFEARSDVTSFRLRLVRMEVSINSITIANRDEPMTNLIELGRMEFRLKPQAILRGKVYIEEIRADTIRFGTARAVSGELPAYKRRQKAEKPPREPMPPLIDFTNFNARALLDQELDKLKTPKAYAEAARAYNAAVEKWKAEIENVQNRAKELQNNAKPILAINPGSFSDIQAVTKTIADITLMVNSVENAVNDVNGIADGVRADVDTALGLERLARNSVNDDIDHLKSYIDLRSGAAFSVIEPLLHDILTDKAEEYIVYGRRALEAFEKLKALSAYLPKSDEKKVKPPTFRGRNVAFPTAEYPAFFLGTLASDFTARDWNWAFELRAVSSHPDISRLPTALDLAVTETGGSKEREIAFNASADFRTNTNDRFSADLRGDGFPVALTTELEAAGIGGFEGSASFGLDFSGYRDGKVSGGGDIAVREAALLNPRGTLAESIDEALRERDNVALGIEYEHLPNARDNLQLTTNLWDLVEDIVKRTIEKYLEKAIAEIERVVRDYVSTQLEGTLLAKVDLDQLFAIVKGDKTALDQLENTLKNKRDELENKVKNIAQEAADEVKRQTEAAVEQARDDVQRQGEEAVKDMLEGKTPTLQAPSIETPSLPSIPGLGGIKLPGR